MPGRSNIETSENSLDFRASIIPYDACEDPNAPILATSGDNINLIFNIKKESFLKLAVAAVTHLGSDFEQAGMCNGSKEFDNSKHKTSSAIPKFRLSDVVHNLESENTKDIIDAYDEDSNTSESSKNKDEILNDSKLCINGGNGLLEECSESLPHDCETENKSSNLENERDGVETFSDHNPDLSDCPELENVWPDIHPFTETEEIPIQEIKSLVLNGFVTKYMKLELSNEFVIIKVTSESNVLVDAVKYKESGKESTREMKENVQSSVADKEHAILSEKESECSVIDAGISLTLQTAASNVNSVAESVPLVEENESGQLINEDISCNSDNTGEFPVAATVQNSASDIPEPKNNLEIEATTNAQSLSENFSNHTTETTNDSSENKSADETLELDSLDKFLENSEFKETSLKIEEKLNEFDINIPGSSPTERLKFALRECLEISSSKVDSKKETKECLSNISQASSENVAVKESDNENFNSQIKEKCLDSFDECGAKSSKIVDSKEMAVECSENEYSDKELNSERQSGFTTSSEHETTSPEKKPLCNSNEHETVNAKDSTKVGKLDLNDHNFKSEDSLYVEETNMEKETFSKPIEEKDSLEDSALGKDLHLSESDVLNDCTKLEDVEYSQLKSKEIGSPEKSRSIPCEIEENKSVEINDNEIPDKNDCTSNNNDLQNEQCQQAAAEETCCQAEIVIESTKLEKFENSLAGSIAEEKDASENKSTDKTCDENKHETNNSEFKCDELKDIEVKIENSHEIIVDTKVEETLNEVSEPESNEESSKSFEKESLYPSSEYLEDSISETTDIEKITENSFASNIDSFMDTTVDANVESASECGDLESDDVKSVASESDDSKDSGKQASIRRNRYKKDREVDEVDCAPTRTRRKGIAVLSKDAIPENTEVKNTKTSNRHTSTLNTPSEYSGRISPVARSLRSKSLDPTPQQSKGNMYDKKHIAESEEGTRRTRAKTPDIIGKKDIKTTARSSPRKLARSSATTEPSSASKVQNTKTSVADSKSRANLDISLSTKRSKRVSKE